MSQYPQQPQPPYQGNQGMPPAGAQRRNSNAIWWVVIGVAAVALVVIGVLVFRAMSAAEDQPTLGPTDSPSQQTTCCGPSPTEPVDPSPSDDPTTPSQDWGDVVPPNVDNLRELLTVTEYPAQVGGMSVGETSFDAGIGTHSETWYESEDPFADDAQSISAAILEGPNRWADNTSDLNGIVVTGDTVCGMPENPVFEGEVLCLVAGQESLLSVFGYDYEVTVEELADYTQEIYDGLR